MVSQLLLLDARESIGCKAGVVKILNMDSDRSRHSRRQGFRQPLDRRVDNWIETGRQVVDGVAGNRPGARRGYSSRLSGGSFERVGRWVGDKLDWFLEDEDSWLEPWQTDTHGSYSSKKRPLEAVSLRGSKSINASTKNSHAIGDEDKWPEESSFRVDRWQRNGQLTQNPDSEKLPSRRRESIRSDSRPLPRSSRRRYS